MSQLHPAPRGPVVRAQPVREPIEQRQAPRPAARSRPPVLAPAARPPGEGAAPTPAVDHAGATRSEASPEERDSSTRPAVRVRPVPRGWPQYRLALTCAALPLASGLTITTIAANTASSLVFSAMAFAGLLTLGLGVILFVVGWAALFEHGRRVKQLTPAELLASPAPPAEAAGLLLLLNLPAALVCLMIGLGQAAANPSFC